MKDKNEIFKNRLGSKSQEKIIYKFTRATLMLVMLMEGIGDDFRSIILLIYILIQSFSVIA